jgi:hypothetical protein
MITEPAWRTRRYLSPDDGAPTLTAGYLVTGVRWSPS